MDKSKKADHGPGVFLDPAGNLLQGRLHHQPTPAILAAYLMIFLALGAAVVQLAPTLMVQGADIGVDPAALLTQA